ncbi:MAG: PIN domain-containing protein [Spirochaetaceae bacterium]|nr:MAG: PIN domain-containing protein [Spirochaetaceae bacterium]
MIFIDSNIPMYLVGAAHPNKDRTISILERLVRDETRLVTDAETLQEILHRYTAIGRTDAIQPAYDSLLEIVDEVFAVEVSDMIRAKEILLSFGGISARDAVHAAVMKNRGLDTLFSFDGGYDALPFLTRLR